MTRYFFDYVSNNQLLRDYNGRDYPDIQDACEHANLLAFHLRHDPANAYAGWSIMVRDALGKKIYDVSVPLGNSGQTAVFSASNDASLQPIAAL